MIPDSFLQWYNASHPQFQQAQASVDKHFHPYCVKRNFLYSSRIKERDSLFEKLESGRYQSVLDVDDIVACQIIVPNLIIENETREKIEDVLDDTHVRSRGSTKKPPDSFRFDSTRVIGKIPPNPLDDKEDPLRTLRIEVQIKTAFEHAWSTATHDLVYKSESPDWRRQRLAAQMKAIVEQMDLMILAFNDVYDKIPESTWDRADREARIASFFVAQVENEKIPAECAPKDWSRFAQNLLSFGHNTKLGEDQLLDLASGAIEERPGAAFPRTISLFQYIACYAIHQSSSNGNALSFKDGYSFAVTPECHDVFSSLDQDTGSSMSWPEGPL